MASTTLERSFVSGLSTLKNAFIYRWSDQAWEEDMSNLTENVAKVWKRTKEQKARGSIMVTEALIATALLLQACVTARDALTPQAPVDNGNTGPRSADTSVAPIKPMLIDGNFLGADEIKKSCESKMGGGCEVFGIAFSNEKDIPKISPFVQHEGDNYVWGGPGRFDRLTQKTKDGKVVWADDNGSIYFVGIPEDGSATELKTLYYVDPDGKVWDLPKPWGKVLASVVKPTQLPTETSTSTPTIAPTLTPSWTPTLAPSLTPIPPSATANRPTVVVQPTLTPRPILQETKTVLPNGYFTVGTDFFLISRSKETDLDLGPGWNNAGFTTVVDCKNIPGSACTVVKKGFATTKDALNYARSIAPNATLRVWVGVDPTYDSKYNTNHVVAVSVAINPASGPGFP